MTWAAWGLCGLALAGDLVGVEVYTGLASS